MFPEGAVEARVGDAASGEGERGYDAADVHRAPCLGCTAARAELEAAAVCHRRVDHQARPREEERRLAHVEHALRDLRGAHGHPLGVHPRDAVDVPEVPGRGVRGRPRAGLRLPKPLLPALLQAPGVDAQRVRGAHEVRAADLPHRAARVGKQGQRGDERRQVRGAGGLPGELLVDDLEAVLAVSRRRREEAGRVVEAEDHAAYGRGARGLVRGRHLALAGPHGRVDGGPGRAEEDGGDADVDGAAGRAGLLRRAEPHGQRVRGLGDVLRAHVRLALGGHLRGCQSRRQQQLPSQHGRLRGGGPKTTWAV
mmetsp:Transcript_113095/g.365312  ORF Transcript_113095/g.365312 Transcript_113095/m.365312 type:complete len:310 (+) Transcript_113095:257-1186(+)